MSQKLIRHLQQRSLIRCLLQNTQDKTKNAVYLPQLFEEKEEETEIIDDESKLNFDKVEEEMIAAYSDDFDEENVFQLDNFKTAKQPLHEINPQNNVDEESWKLEIERVLLVLKITIKNESPDWRAHLEQMKAYKNSINETLGPTKTQLEKYVSKYIIYGGGMEYLEGLGTSSVTLLERWIVVDEVMVWGGTNLEFRSELFRVDRERNTEERYISNIVEKPIMSLALFIVQEYLQEMEIDVSSEKSRPQTNKIHVEHHRDDVKVVTESPEHYKMALN
ncbi:hypothetical protein ABEB36_003896 [Hypothenemus hampei]|uniref:Uncharacterized protein n=1 Tax=Hypothenemus hampei TaxID=57062 RepID=A0ABD1F1H1_HYPHA